MKTIGNLFICFVILVFVAVACGDPMDRTDDTPTDQTVVQPSLETVGVENITKISAVIEGNIVSDGGVKLTECGFFWSMTNTDPGLETDNFVEAEASVGTIRCELKGLLPNTEYFYVAWARNREDLEGFGSPMSFTTKSSTHLDSVGIDWITVQGGSFQMGNDNGDLDEKPKHTISLNSFQISKYEITLSQYVAFLNDIGCKQDGSFNDPEFGHVEYIDMDDEDCAIGYADGKFVYTGSIYSDTSTCPVFEVTWHGANAYCRNIGGRLPTEAEWEFAARGGNQSKGYLFSGSNNADEVAWHVGNSKNRSHPYGLKQENELGLCDMSGNVWEWCNDIYSSRYYGESEESDPQGPVVGPRRVIRGGCWYYNENSCRTTNRNFQYPFDSYNYIGFRVVHSL